MAADDRSAHDRSTQALPVQSPREATHDLGRDPVDASGGGDGSRRRPRGGRLRRGSGRAWWLLPIAGLVVVVVLVLGLLGAIPRLANPFGAQSTDRSQPPLLTSIRNLARFDAASGNFQVIVDVQHDRAHIPDILLSDRSLFVAAGTVDAYVDFSRLAGKDVVTSSDRRTATVSLPAPALGTPALDLNRSYVASEQKGLLNKLNDMVNGDPNKQQQLYTLAQQKIAGAAAASELAQRAETNTTAMLKGLLGSLGFTTVTVNFPKT